MGSEKENFPHRDLLNTSSLYCDVVINFCARESIRRVHHWIYTITMSIPGGPQSADQGSGWFLHVPYFPSKFWSKIEVPQIQQKRWEWICAPSRQGRFWEIYPWRLRDFLRLKRFPEREARWKSQGSREILRDIPRQLVCTLRPEGKARENGRYVNFSPAGGLSKQLLYSTTTPTIFIFIFPHHTHPQYLYLYLQGVFFSLVPP